MNGQFLANLLKAGTAGVRLAQQRNGKPRRKRKGGKGGRKLPEDCSPCAAQAYIDSLRPTPQE